MESIREPSDVARRLIIDLYELTMVDVYRREAMADRRATFSMFVRSLPTHRGYLVAAGLDDVLRWIEQFRFGPDELSVIDRLGIFDTEFIDWLGEFEFTGSVRAVAEGTIVFAEEPLLEVDAPIAQAQIIETYVLNQMSMQTTLATKAARCRHAADGRRVIDFGLRSSHGVDAGMKLARVSRLIGLAGTSNVAGADRYGIAANGTMAHSFVQAHHDEIDAYRAFASAFGDSTVLLVDTYDTRRGIERAVTVASEMEERGHSLLGIRLDSGDHAGDARFARRSFDDAGLHQVQIFASGGLDEHAIHRLVHDEHAPIDGFGIGASLSVSDDAPRLDAVYKLVEYDGRPVRKTSVDKAIWPGAKQVWRRPDFSSDVIAGIDEPTFQDHAPLLETVMSCGRRTGAGRRTLGAAHDHFIGQWERLPDETRRLRDPSPPPVSISDHTRETAATLDHMAAAAAAAAAR